MRSILVALAVTLGPQFAAGQEVSSRFVASLSAVPAFSVNSRARSAYSGGFGAAVSTSLGTPRLAIGLASGLYRMQRPTYGGTWSRWHTIGYGSVHIERQLLASSGSSSFGGFGGAGGYVSRSDNPGVRHALRFGYHAGIRYMAGRAILDVRYLRIGDGSLTALVPVSLGLRF